MMPRTDEDSSGTDKRMTRRPFSPPKLRVIRAIIYFANLLLLIGVLMPLSVSCSLTIRDPNQHTNHQQHHVQQSPALQHEFRSPHTFKMESNTNTNTDSDPILPIVQPDNEGKRIPGPELVPILISESRESSASLSDFPALLDSAIRSLAGQMVQQIRESEDRMMGRIEAMERKLHQSLLQSSSKVEKMMDEQVFYCSQSLINVMSLVESKVSQSTDQITKSKDALEQKLDSMNHRWSSWDQVITGRLEAHEAVVQSQVRQLSSDSDLKYRSLVNSVHDVTSSLKSMNQSLIQREGVRDENRGGAAGMQRSRSLTLSRGDPGSSVDDQLKKIDMDVETYTKKVVNNMSDLWRISKSVQEMANSSAQAMNQSLGHMSRELDRMNHSLAHDLPTGLTIVHRSLESRFNELADKVLESHNVILVNQNHFRESCLRIQGEEGQVYDEFDARLEIMNATMFSMIDMESRMSERMDKKLHDIFTLMEKTVRFVKHRFREFPDSDTSLRFNTTSP